MPVFVAGTNDPTVGDRIVDTQDVARVVRALAGDDLVRENGGDDSVDGGNGDDTLQGGGGDDWSAWGPGNDSFDGGDGFDIVADGESMADDVHGRLRDVVQRHTAKRSVPA